MVLQHQLLYNRLRASIAEECRNPVHSPRRRTTSQISSLGQCQGFMQIIYHVLLAWIPYMVRRWRSGSTWASPTYHLVTCWAGKMPTPMVLPLEQAEFRADIASTCIDWVSEPQRISVPGGGSGGLLCIYGKPELSIRLG